MVLKDKQYQGVTRWVGGAVLLGGLTAAGLASGAGVASADDADPSAGRNSVSQANAGPGSEKPRHVTKSRGPGPTLRGDLRIASQVRREPHVSTGDVKIAAIGPQPAVDAQPSEVSGAAAAVSSPSLAGSVPLPTAVVVYPNQPQKGDYVSVKASDFASTDVIAKISNLSVSMMLDNIPSTADTIYAVKMEGKYQPARMVVFISGIEAVNKDTSSLAQAIVSNAGIGYPAVFNYIDAFAAAWNPKEIVIVGHSNGTQQAQYYAAFGKNKDKVKLLVLFAPIFVKNPNELGNKSINALSLAVWNQADPVITVANSTRTSVINNYKKNVTSYIHYFTNGSGLDAHGKGGYGPGAKSIDITQKKEPRGLTKIRSVLRNLTLTTVTYLGLPGSTRSDTFYNYNYK